MKTNDDPADWRETRAEAAQALSSHHANQPGSGGDPSVTTASLTEIMKKRRRIIIVTIQDFMIYIQPISELSKFFRFFQMKNTPTSERKSPPLRNNEDFFLS